MWSFEWGPAAMLLIRPFMMQYGHRSVPTGGHRPCMSIVPLGQAPSPCQESLEFPLSVAGQISGFVREGFSPSTITGHCSASGPNVQCVYIGDVQPSIEHHLTQAAVRREVHFDLALA